MRVLIWPYARQKREIKLFIGVEKILDAGDSYIFIFENPNRKPEVFLKSYIHKFMVDD